MVNNLLQLNIPEITCLWILEFLTNRKQSVRVNSVLLSQCVINTGAPQGCVLFILYTNSFTAGQRDCHVFKYADDTDVLGKITNSDESYYRQEVTDVVDWCTEHHLVLNTGKTKELIIDLRSRSLCHHPVFIHSTPVSIVSTYKYLGTIFDDKLKWNANVGALCSKGNQRQYFIGNLNLFTLIVPF